VANRWRRAMSTSIMKDGHYRCLLSICCNKIAHHYFEVDAEVVLLTVKEDIPQVKDIVEKMIVELNKK
jgi:uncharacterized protein with HEPN domain